MLNFFRCKHPAKYLHVQKEHTEKVVDEDYTDITYHLYCIWCDAEIPIVHSKAIGGVDGLMRRAEARYARRVK